MSLTSPHGKIELPAYPSASLHPGTVAVAMGQGHEYLGAYARARGLNAGANPMRLLGGTPEAGSGALPHLAVKVSLAKTGSRRALAIPQATHDQDHRELAQHMDSPRRGRSSCAVSRPSTRAIRACTLRSSTPSIAGG